MSNERTSITAMCDISDRTAFNNGHRQQRLANRQREMEGAAGGTQKLGGKVARSVASDGWIKNSKLHVKIRNDR